MFLQMMQIEQGKLRKRTMLWVEAVIVVGIVISFFGALYAVQTTGDMDNGNIRVEGTEDIDVTEMMVWPAGATLGFSAIGAIGSFLMIVMTGAFTAQEYTWGSYQLWLSRGVPRPLVILAKFILMALVAFLFVLIAVILGGGISAMFSQVYLGTVPFDSINWPVWGQSILVMSYSLLPYIALALFLAIIGRSTTLAIGGALAYTLLLEPIIGQLAMLLGGRWQTAVRYLPGNLAQSLGVVIEHTSAAAGDLSMMEVPESAVSVETAVIGLAIYIILFLGASLYVFQRQDLGG